jgi:hypothetical protein
VHTGILWRNLKEGGNFEDLAKVRRIILNWIFNTQDGGRGLD